MTSTIEPIPVIARYRKVMAAKDSKLLDTPAVCDAGVAGEAVCGDHPEVGRLCVHSMADHLDTHTAEPTPCDRGCGNPATVGVPMEVPFGDNTSAWVMGLEQLCDADAATNLHNPLSGVILQETADEIDTVWHWYEDGCTVSPRLLADPDQDAWLRVDDPERRIMTGLEYMENLQKRPMDRRCVRCDNKYVLAEDFITPIPFPVPVTPHRMVVLKLRWSTLAVLCEECTLHGLTEWITSHTPPAA